MILRFLRLDRSHDPSGLKFLDKRAMRNASQSSGDAIKPFSSISDKNNICYPMLVVLPCIQTENKYIPLKEKIDEILD